MATKGKGRAPKAKRHAVEPLEERLGSEGDGGDASSSDSSSLDSQLVRIPEDRIHSSS